MDNQGAEISTKIRSAIKAKIAELGAYVDQELPDYVMVMVANRKTKQQMVEDLSLFLGKNAEAFTDWLHEVLERLHAISATTTRPAVAATSATKLEDPSKPPKEPVKVDKEEKQEPAKKRRISKDKIALESSAKASSTERPSKVSSSSSRIDKSSSRPTKKRKSGTSSSARNAPIKIRRPSHHRHDEAPGNDHSIPPDSGGASGSNARDMRARMEMRGRERQMREDQQRKRTGMREGQHHHHHSRKSHDDQVGYEESGVIHDPIQEALNVEVGDDFDDEDLLEEKEAAAPALSRMPPAKSATKSGERKSVMQRLQPPPTNVVRPMQRLDEVGSSTRGHPTRQQRSVVAQVLRREEVPEEEYDPFYPAIGNVASVVRVTQRKSQVPREMQPRSSIFLRAIKDATTDFKVKRVCKVGDKYQVVRSKRRAPEPIDDQTDGQSGEVKKRSKRKSKRRSGEVENTDENIVSAAEISAEVEAVLHDYDDEEEEAEIGRRKGQGSSYDLAGQSEQQHWVQEEESVLEESNILDEEQHDEVEVETLQQARDTTKGVRDNEKQIVLRSRHGDSRRKKKAPTVVAEEVTEMVETPSQGGEVVLYEENEVGERGVPGGVVIYEAGEEGSGGDDSESDGEPAVSGGVQMSDIRRIQKLPDGQLILIRSPAKAAPQPVVTKLAARPKKQIVTLRRHAGGPGSSAKSAMSASREPIVVRADPTLKRERRVNNMRRGEVIVYETAEPEEPADDQPSTSTTVKTSKGTGVQTISRNLLDSQLHSVKRLLQTNDRKSRLSAAQAVNNKPSAAINNLKVSSGVPSHQLVLSQTVGTMNSEDLRLRLQKQPHKVRQPPTAITPSALSGNESGQLMPKYYQITEDSGDGERSLDQRTGSSWHHSRDRDSRHRHDRYKKSAKTPEKQDETIEEVVIFQQAPGDRQGGSFFGTGSGDSEVEAKVAEAIAAMDPDTDELLIIDESRGIETRFVVTLDGADGRGRRNKLVDHPGGYAAVSSNLATPTMVANNRTDLVQPQPIVLDDTSTDLLTTSAPLAPISAVCHHHPHTLRPHGAQPDPPQQYIQVPIAAIGQSSNSLQGRAQAVASIMSSLGVVTGGNIIGASGSPVGAGSGSIPVASVTPITIPMDDSDDDDDGYHLSPTGRQTYHAGHPVSNSAIGVAAGVGSRQVRGVNPVKPVAQQELINPPGNAIHGDPLGSVEKPRDKIMERCRFWPSCKQGDACAYYHPTTPCKAFPNCRFGDKCLFSHPNCKFDAHCVNPSCPFTHAVRRGNQAGIGGQGMSQPAHYSGYVGERGSGLGGGQTAFPCRFGSSCTNQDCTFRHSKTSGVPCKFGSGCTRSDCSFFHPSMAGNGPGGLRQGGKPGVGKFKWNARLHPSRAVDGVAAV